MSQFFFQLNFSPCKAEQPLPLMELQDKEKDEKHRGKLSRKNPREKTSINFGLITIYIKGQRKEFCWQRIPERSGTKNETVDIEILITSRKGDRKIMQKTRITSGHATTLRR